jgi:hypothetical protein
MAFTEKIDRADVIDRLAVTSFTLSALKKKGMPFEGNGRTERFPWPDVRDWYNNYLAKNPKLSPGQPAKEQDPHLLDYARRKAKADAAIREHKLRVMRREVVSVALVKELTGEVFGRIKERLVVLPSEFGPRTVNINGIPESFAIWQEAMGLVIAEIADDILSMPEAQQATADADADDEDDDA